MAQRREAATGAPDRDSAPVAVVPRPSFGVGRPPQSTLHFRQEIQRLTAEIEGLQHDLVELRALVEQTLKPNGASGTGS
jgi:hypothetical protein